jgi:hypothetical protein
VLFFICQVKIENCSGAACKRLVAFLYLGTRRRRRRRRPCPRPRSRRRRRRCRRPAVAAAVRASIKIEPKGFRALKERFQSLRGPVPTLEHPVDS